MAEEELVATVGAVHSAYLGLEIHLQVDFKAVPVVLVVLVAQVEALLSFMGVVEQRLATAGLFGH